MAACICLLPCAALRYGLFATTEGSVLMYPNPAAQAIPQGLALLEFVGKLSCAADLSNVFPVKWGRQANETVQRLSASCCASCMQERDHCCI